MESVWQTSDWLRCRCPRRGCPARPAVNDRASGKRCRVANRQELRGHERPLGGLYAERVDEVDALRDVILPIFVTVVGTVIAAAVVAAASAAWKRYKAGTGGVRSWLVAAASSLGRHWRLVALIATVAGLLVASTILMSTLASAPTSTPRPAASSSESPKPRQTAGQQVSSPEVETPTLIDEPGWGPERPTVNAASRVAQVTLNSMVDNPVHGDERNFAQVRDSEDTNAEYADKLVVEPGGVYVAFFYFNNDAIESEDAYTAHDVRLSVQAPGVFRGSTSVYGVLRASNAAPSEVWDGFTLALGAPDAEAALRYVADSATLHVGGDADGTILDDQALFSNEGALLGCDAVDGQVPSAASCSGYVTLKLRVDQPNFVVTANARLAGTDDSPLDHVQVRRGDIVQMNVMYQNTGSNQQDNVSVRAILPPGFQYVNGSSEIANSTTGGIFEPTIDGIATTGVNAGSYQPRGNVFYRFQVIVGESALADASGWVFVPNIVRVTTNAGYKEAPLTFVLLQ